MKQVFQATKKGDIERVKNKAQLIFSNNQNLNAENEILF